MLMMCGAAASGGEQQFLTINVCTVLLKSLVLESLEMAACFLSPKLLTHPASTVKHGTCPRSAVLERFSETNDDEESFVICSIIH